MISTHSMSSSSSLASSLEISVLPYLILASSICLINQMRGEYIHTRRTYSIFKCGTISWQPYIPLEYSCSLHYFKIQTYLCINYVFMIIISFHCSKLLSLHIFHKDFVEIVFCVLQRPKVYLSSQDWCDEMRGKLCQQWNGIFRIWY